LKYN